MTDEADEDEPRPRRPWWKRPLGIAALSLVGLFGVCSLALPSYRIPSGSMLPTVRADDHVLVNRMAYGAFGGEPARGELLVFRYPLDERQTFFKRVLGLPGDEVKEEGRTFSIKRSGAADFEPIAREALERPCTDDSGSRQISDCTIYEETLDGRTYTVRYRLTTQERAGEAPPRTWVVPEGCFFVVGDNRNDSLDSRRWELPDGTPAPFVSRDQVIGRMQWIYWPPSRAQSIR